MPEEDTKYNKEKTYLCHELSSHWSHDHAAVHGEPIVAGYRDHYYAWR